LLGGVPLGFGNIPVLALGNADLEVEEIQTWEIGYTGVLDNRALVTLDYYNSTAENFISDLLPNLGSGGRLNPNFQFYTPPAGLSPMAQAILLQQIQALFAQVPILPFLSNNFDGAPIIALATYTNFGEVETQGIDLGLQWHISRPWTFNFNYSWFDFDVVEAPSDALAEQLKPNAPEHGFSAGLLYAVDRWDAGLNFRWVDAFEWTVGVFNGPVESYEVVDLTANYRPTDVITLGVNVSNLLDNEHWESFGGDVLGRRALGSVQFSW
jgi:iron complex outermembrane receptor protein